ncbi:hypothetical protein [Mechercharimyces sp. CAU 1602]|uniref:hypothetical protein n=1 Tax=Mechercharimyces sp. CAU 1602 TaxID=2973933 RepID=UPI00216132D9|nr:hypothetical protein [Mechercharimyces sp. CAU 1602]
MERVAMDERTALRLGQLTYGEKDREKAFQEAFAPYFHQMTDTTTGKEKESKSSQEVLKVIPWQGRNIDGSR